MLFIWEVKIFQIKLESVWICPTDLLLSKTCLKVHETCIHDGRRNIQIFYLIKVATVQKLLLQLHNISIKISEVKKNRLLPLAHFNSGGM